MKELWHVFLWMFIPGLIWVVALSVWNEIRTGIIQNHIRRNYDGEQREHMLDKARDEWSYRFVNGTDKRPKRSAGAAAKSITCTMQTARLLSRIGFLLFVVFAVIEYADHAAYPERGWSFALIAALLAFVCGVIGFRKEWILRKKADRQQQAFNQQKQIR